MKSHFHSMHASIALALILGISACADPSQSTESISLDERNASQVPWAGNPQLANAISALRDTTDQYHDVDVAFAAGYRPAAVGCEDSAIGAMGIHYGHGGLLGIVRGSNPTRGTDPNIDPLRPEIILYEPQKDGSRRLVAVEFVVYKAAWDAAHPGTQPTFYGVPFDVRQGANAHGHADHYELHLWLWRHNPLGMFAPWNPNVTCEYE